VILGPVSTMHRRCRRSGYCAPSGRASARCCDPSPPPCHLPLLSCCWQAAAKLADALAAHLTGLNLGSADTRDAPAGAGGDAGGGANGKGAGQAVDPDIDAFDRAVEGQGGGSNDQGDQRAVPPCYKVWGLSGFRSGNRSPVMPAAAAGLKSCAVDPPTNSRVDVRRFKCLLPATTSSGLMPAARNHERSRACCRCSRQLANRTQTCS
jgi:hypothetical protein